MADEEIKNQEQTKMLDSEQRKTTFGNDQCKIIFVGKNKSDKFKEKIKALPRANYVFIFQDVSVLNDIGEITMQADRVSHTEVEVQK